MKRQRHRKRRGNVGKIAAVVILGFLAWIVFSVVTGVQKQGLNAHLFDQKATEPKTDPQP